MGLKPSKYAKIDHHRTKKVLRIVHNSKHQEPKRFKGANETADEILKVA